MIARIKKEERVKKSDMTERVRYETAGFFSSRGEWCHPHRSITSLEYLYMTDGVAYIEEDGTRYTLERGALLLLSPDVHHGGFRKSEGTVSFFWMHFTGIDPALLPKIMTVDESSRLILLFRQLLHYANSSEVLRESRDLMTRLILCEILAERDRREASTTALYGRMCEFCRMNASRALTVSEVAAHFHYNKDYVNRMFVKFSGTGLKAYIVACRIAYIRTLLLSDIPLKVVAQRSGFDDVRDFLKFFRYHESMTPTEFRNLYYHIHMNNH